MVGKAALITEGRSPGATRGCSLGHVAARIIEWPVAPIGYDDIIINAAKGAVAVKLGATEFDVAACAWKPHELRFTSGPACNAEQVGPTLAVSATHPYVKPEKACYADI
jgi:dihydroxyacid dehydratase/phosphogluconate dehydratase